jgi:formylmethanofuran--tetrahydromethanopterin N-formyltransferase
MMEIDDTYCELFDGLFLRIIVTARDDSRLRMAALNATSLPSTVFDEAEGGVERWLDEEETPDGRKGAIIQIWVRGGEDAVENLEYQSAKRIRQGILVVPTTSIFNALESNSNGYIDVMDRIGHCGDGYEEVRRYHSREVIAIPLMMGEFLIERRLGYARGVMGGNIWFFCKTEDAAIEAGDRAVEAIRDVDGVITPFDVCSAGSKPETNYPEIGPTTNHLYCPILRDRIGDSKVPDGVLSIPEIVIDGISIEAVKEAMIAAVYAIEDVKGVIRVSAGNYGGRLGRHRIYLRDIIRF